MGTQKQADALIKNLNRIGRAQVPPEQLSPEQVAAYTAKILAMPLKGVQAEFNKLNKILKFERDSSPANIDQRKLIAQLEIANYGTKRTTWIDSMTFQQASDVISSLITQRDATRAGVSQLEALANEQVPATATRHAPTS